MEDPNTFFSDAFDEFRTINQFSDFLIPEIPDTDAPGQYLSNSAEIEDSAARAIACKAVKKGGLDTSDDLEVSLNTAQYASADLLDRMTDEAEEVISGSWKASLPELSELVTSSDLQPQLDYVMDECSSGPLSIDVDIRSADNETSASLQTNVDHFLDSNKMDLEEIDIEHLSSSTACGATPNASIIRAWFDSRKHYPYPTCKELKELVLASGLSRKQVRTKLTNMRARCGALSESVSIPLTSHVGLTKTSQPASVQSSKLEWSVAKL